MNTQMYTVFKGQGSEYIYSNEDKKSEWCATQLWKFIDYNYPKLLNSLL